IVRVRGPDDITTEFISSAEDLENWKKRERSNAPELWLRHVRQFYSVVNLPSTPIAGDDVLNMKAKVVRLAALLSEIVFVQCMVFCNDKFRAEALAIALAGQGWPAACITGSQTQTTRMEVMEDFRASRSRVLVSTDLTARGIDVENVNFVVNLDLPRDPATYLHRVGRTGRFGVKGLAVTLLSAKEVHGVHLLARVFKMEINELPCPVPPEIYTYAAAEESGDDEETEKSTEYEQMCHKARVVAHEPNKCKDDATSDIDSSPTPELGNTPLSAKTSTRYDMEEKSYDRWAKLL
ncbi:Hypothetical protein PHPALM_37735, partial [Phytophthora palmivora]